MAIIGPSDLPRVMKISNDEQNAMKHYILSQLGHPVVLVEITENQFESVLKVICDFIARYFPLEERYAFFMTQPLQSEYELPKDAYWIRELAWDPATTRIGDIFGAESFLFNIGNISGIQNLLTDYHLLQSYRKFSQRILGTEGQWEFSVSANGGKGAIRLYPIPKGAFPVVVRYIPQVTEFRSPQARMITYAAALAQMKMVLGHARRKITGMPTPEGGTITYDGEQLIQEGKEEWEKVQQDAINQGAPLGIYVW